MPNPKDPQAYRQENEFNHWNTTTAEVQTAQPIQKASAHTQAQTEHQESDQIESLTPPSLQYAAGATFPNNPFSSQTGDRSIQRMPIEKNTPLSQPLPIGSTMQMKCNTCEEEEKSIQAKFAPRVMAASPPPEIPAQFKCNSCEEEEKSIQAKFAPSTPAPIHNPALPAQFKCKACDEEEVHQHKKAPNVIQRWELPDWAQDAIDTGSDWFDGAVESGQEFIDGVGDAVDSGLQAGQEFIEEARQRVNETVDNIGGAAGARPWDEDPANACKPYTNAGEAAAAKAYAFTTLIPSSAGMFGAEVAAIWTKYLTSGGYNTYGKGTGISNAFADSQVMKDHHQRLMTWAQRDGLSDFMAATPNTWVDIPVERIFQNSDLNYPIDFNNPFDIPGHIAGGAGESRFGPDTRKLSGHISVFREVDDDGNTTKIKLKSKFTFVVKDGVDFCPGNMGAGYEQLLTLPLSRLEATGMAWDVGITVTYDMPEATVEFDPGSPSTTPTVPDDGRNMRDRTPGAERGLQEKDRVSDRVSR